MVLVLPRLADEQRSQLCLKCGLAGGVGASNHQQPAVSLAGLSDERWFAGASVAQGGTRCIRRDLVASELITAYHIYISRDLSVIIKINQSTTHELKLSQLDSQL